jgi:hypothetical protein
VPGLSPSNDAAAGFTRLSNDYQPVIGLNR